MSTLDLRGQLTDQRLLVMGGTGFLGKVTLSLLLHRFPEIGQIWLVVRPKGTMTSPERFDREILTSEAFNPLREVHGDGYEAFMRSKITAIPGDLSEEYAGVPQDVRDTIRGQVDCLLNSFLSDLPHRLIHIQQRFLFQMANSVAFRKYRFTVEVLILPGENA